MTDIEMHDLQSCSFVDFHAGTGLQTTIESLFAAAGVHRHITFRVGDMDRLLELVRYGLGVTVVPEPIAQRSGLRRIRMNTGNRCRTLALVGRTNASPSRAARLLLDLLTDPIA